MKPQKPAKIALSGVTGKELSIRVFDDATAQLNPKTMPPMGSYPRPDSDSFAEDLQNSVDMPAIEAPSGFNPRISSAALHDDIEYLGRRFRGKLPSIGLRRS